MKKIVFLSLALLALPTVLQAQDDMYFVPTKANVEKSMAEYGMPRDTYYSGSRRAVDDYNRQGSFVQSIDSVGNDIISFDGAMGVYPDSTGMADDYKYTRRMSRFDDYVNNGIPLADKAVKIYLANTKNTAVTSGWIDEKDMTLVCDTTVTFLNGSHTLFFDIATPFAYTGGNLCIMTQKTGTEQSDDIYFYAAATDEPRTAIYNGDDAEVNLSSVQAATRLNLVRIVKGGKGASGIATNRANSKMQLRMANGVTSTTNGETVNFTVTNLSGKTMAVKNNTKSISLATLPGGIYIVKAEANGQRTTLKMAK